MIEIKNFKGNIIIIGYGGIASSLTPDLIINHGVDPKKIIVITKDTVFEDIAREFKLDKFYYHELTKDNYFEILEKYVKKGDHIINLSVDVDNRAIASYSIFKECTYLDTAHEPWPGTIDNRDKSIKERSGAKEREIALKLAKDAGNNCSTILFCSGMNPGVVSYFVKIGLYEIAKRFNIEFKLPKEKKEWALLAKEIGLKTIHISEHDTQIADYIKYPDTFCNTWSCDGFRTEGMQPSEGWAGTHENLELNGMNIYFEGQRAFDLNRPGTRTKVKTYTPNGIVEGYVIQHNESLSIGDLLSIIDEDNKIIYAPTVHYAYCPSDAAQISINELNATQDYTMPPKQHLLRNEIIDGKDELGILLMGVYEGKPYSYWVGSLLSIEDARAVCNHNSATSLQVIGGVVSGTLFCINNPYSGVLETDDLYFVQMMEWSLPYMGEMFSDFVPFNPLNHKDPYFKNNYNDQNPFAFENFLVK